MEKTLCFLKKSYILKVRRIQERGIFVILRKKKKIACLIIGSFMTIASITGCAKIESSSPEDGYNTAYAMSAVEYTIFMSKQITVAENVLFTRFSMIDSVQDGTYETSKEIQSTEESISKIESIKDEITMTMPATNYESDRQNTLDLMEDARLALEDYLAALQGNGNLDTCKELLKSCYLALSGEANIYYE